MIDAGGAFYSEIKYDTCRHVERKVNQMFIFIYSLSRSDFGLNADFQFIKELTITSWHGVTFMCFGPDQNSWQNNKKIKDFLFFRLKR